MEIQLSSKIPREKLESEQCVKTHCSLSNFSLGIFDDNCISETDQAEIEPRHVGGRKLARERKNGNSKIQHKSSMHGEDKQLTEISSRLVIWVEDIQPVFLTGLLKSLIFYNC